MWRRDGRGQAYAYHPRMLGKYGDEYDFPTDFRFSINQPIQLRIAVKINDAGAANGALKVWARLPGAEEQLMINQSEMQWAKNPEIGVDGLLFNVFHGGNDRSWAPSNDCRIVFDDLSHH
jgi:hypothetical protein